MQGSGGGALEPACLFGFPVGGIQQFFCLFEAFRRVQSFGSVAVVCVGVLPAVLAEFRIQAAKACFQVVRLIGKEGLCHGAASVQKFLLFRFERLNPPVHVFYVRFPFFHGLFHGLKTRLIPGVQGILAVGGFCFPQAD